MGQQYSGFDASDHFFSNRSDPSYLKKLKETISIESLKETALDIEKEINGILYKKCINIDFCGIAASTLFYSNSDDLESVTKDNIELRKEISIIFKSLFQEQTLKDLNNDFISGPYYLRVRFCFSYLYSDYPICLIKAEERLIWSELVNKPIDNFFENKPVLQSDFENSYTNRHQENSLKGIISILKDNSELVFTEESEKKTNTIQIRFSVIPSPLCCLVVNNTAFCDPYMYAKSGDQLSLNFPVVILNNEKEEILKGFNSIKSHFYYLWRHDLTLFCKDATNFRPENENIGIGGLIPVLPPDIIAGEQGTDWKYKVERIWERKMGKGIEKQIQDKEEINKWKFNVRQKFLSCTRKLKVNKQKDGDLTIKIGMRREFFYYRIFIKKKDIEFEYLDKKSNTAFKALAHYCFAVKANKKPIMHRYVRNESISRFAKEIMEQLDSSDLSKNDAGRKHFSDIFIVESDSMRIIIDSDDIEIDFNNLEKLNKATYNTNRSNPPQLGCLDFLE